MRTRILTALIETRQHVAAGWVQWVWKDEGGCCLVGALRRACNLDLVSRNMDDDYWVYRALHDRLMAQLPEIGEHTPLMLWNDMEGRTQADVLDVIDRAIAKMLAEREPSLAPAAHERELEPA
jgi:hypothetical protein